MSILARMKMTKLFEGVFQPKWLAAFIVAAMATLSFAGQASADTRSLKLYFIHTKERAEIVYKRNGRYDQQGLKQINRFLRDWRRNEPANMDPRLLDLVWEVYRSVGARDHIHVVSAYRSPATNNMLRGRSSGVAKKSQHMLGKAMDFYIPGVALSKLRAAAFKVEGGGVGYYPKSGSPFVHLDVGNVRSWPRMSRKELVALFPNGRTMHLPSDGKPLPGYNQALAAYQARRKSGGQVHVASAPVAAEKPRSGNKRGLLAGLFGGGGADEQEDNSESVAVRGRAVAAAPVPSQPVAPTGRAPQVETIIAALPERNIPLPGAAPRPLIDVRAPTQQAALAPSLPSAANPVPVAEQAQDILALAAVPLPTRRPNYSAPSAVEAEPELRVAAAELPQTVNLPVSAIAAERARGGGTDAIAEMLAASGAQTHADVVINAPVPTKRPRAATQVAALESGMTDSLADVIGSDVAGADVTEVGEGRIFALAALPDPAARSQPVSVPMPAGLRDERATGVTSGTPRIAVIGRAAGTDAAAALESGVRTTGKASRPQAGQVRPEPKAVVAPLSQDVARIAFIDDLTVTTAGGATTPDKAHAIVRSAPKAVYTQGFTRSASTPDADRFSGKAVTFLAVAKFATN